jgi:CrcB protein
MNGLLLAAGVGVLGGLGSVVRFAVYRAVVRVDPTDFPLGTFIVNVAGAFLLGLLFGVHAVHDVALVAGLGFLGGLTTFSTWIYESERLAVDGSPAGALRNIVLSTLAGLGAVALGALLGGAL